MVERPVRTRKAVRVPLSLYLSLQGAPALGSVVDTAFFHSPSTASPSRWLPSSRQAQIRNKVSTSTSRKSRQDLLRSTSNDNWKLRSSPRSPEKGSIGEGNEDDDDSNSSFPDTLGQGAPRGVTNEKWARVLQSARDRKAEDDRLFPRPSHRPSHVATVTLQALRQNDVPYPNFGCEVAIRFSSASNPAAGFTPGGMRTYIDDPSMPFYRILGDWDEMGVVEEAEDDVADTDKANQQIRVKRKGDSDWSTVSMDFVREQGCWLIERLWIDDKSVAGGGRAQAGDVSLPRPNLSVAELFDEDRLEVMSCRYADYDPASLAARGEDWLEERPNPSLSPKAVALTCIISLRQNDDGSGGGGGGGHDNRSGGDDGDRVSQRAVVRDLKGMGRASVPQRGHLRRRDIRGSRGSAALQR